MLHSAAQDFEPTGTLTDVTSLSVTDITTHIHFGRRLREREVARTHSYLGLRSEHLAGEKQYGLLEVGESYVLVYVKTFNLVEYAVRTCAYGLGKRGPDIPL